MPNEISAMLPFDKPANITSFKAVHKIRKILNVKKAGHCGTLDPAATGLLLIMLGKATKLQDKFMKQDKVYLASFLLGTVTDSGDLDGNIIAQKELLNIDIGKIKETAQRFLGEIEQVPPMYSALKHKGKKLYELARQGIIVERKPRKVIIKNIDVISFDDNVVWVRVCCSSGTYIRTLAEDMGSMLGCGAAVKELRREKIGCFSVSGALKDNELGDIGRMLEKTVSLETLRKFYE